MKKETLHTLAADKLYLLSSIDAWNGAPGRKAFYDAVLNEGRMNYFFLCQYMSELLDADLINWVDDAFFLTDEGKNVLAMFGDEAEPMAGIEKTPEVHYAVYDEGHFRVYQKRVDDALVFSLALSKDAFDLNLSGSDEAQVEELMQRIEEDKNR